MIISHKHKSIFIKTQKTAGTSFEIAFSEFCGSRDVITPISPEDEAFRKRLGYRGAQNYFVPMGKYSAHDWKNLVLKGKRREFRNHMGALAIKSLIDSQLWNDYYKFCFERNPWGQGNIMVLLAVQIRAQAVNYRIHRIGRSRDDQRI